LECLAGALRRRPRRVRAILDLLAADDVGQNALVVLGFGGLGLGLRLARLHDRLLARRGQPVTFLGSGLDCALEPVHLGLRVAEGLLLLLRQAGIGPEPVVQLHDAGLRLLDRGGGGRRLPAPALQLGRLLPIG
jgi:hypothetical protein